ncbi:MAG: folate-binding protein, partial [Gammaproteobacteria bacterium]
MSQSTFLSFVRVNGADAAGFLNGQFTQNVSNLAPEETRIGAFCTPKGRVMAVAYLHQTADGLELWTARDLLDELVATLRRSVMRP